MALDKFGFPQGFQTPAMLKDIENATQQVQNLKDQWTKDGFGVIFLYVVCFGVLSIERLFRFIRKTY